jgi:general secretion pathway protein G
MIRHLRETKGFSLLELMIALAIIGILATALAPSLFKYIRTAKIRTTQQELRVIKDNLILYYNEHNMRFPKSLEQLVKEGYFSNSNKLVDKWGRPYWYRAYSSEGGVAGQYFEVGSVGPDGKKGTGDDIFLREGQRFGRQ